MADNKYEVFGQLILLGKDLQTNISCVVSLTPKVLSLPTCDWSEEVTADIKYLIDKYVDLDIAWINPILVGVANRADRKVYVVFAGLIPPDTPLRESYWLRVDEVEDASLDSMLVDAMRKL